MLSAGLVAIGLPLADPIIAAQRGHGSTLLAAMDDRRSAPET